jgi:hypothetical protein
MILLLIIAGILLELIVLLIGAYFFIKYFYKVKSSSDKSITPEIIRDGIRSALQEITYNEEQEKLHEKKMKSPDYIYSTSHHDDPIISDGDLIPYGLTEKERTTLEMFYNKDD